MKENKAIEKDIDHTVKSVNDLNELKEELNNSINNDDNNKDVIKNKEWDKEPVVAPVNKIKAVVKMTAKLRSAESIDPKNVLCLVNKGTTVEILQKKGRFCKVKIKDKEGFMMTNLLVEC